MRLGFEGNPQLGQQPAWANVYLHVLHGQTKQNVTLGLKPR